MITELMVFFNSVTLPINFVCHICVWIGSFYVALHNRNLPTWHVTPLWYLGLVNLFVAVTILVQWVIGPEHPLSYWNFGLFGETLSNIILASIVIVMFLVTILNDFKGRKQRLHRLTK